MYTNWASDLEVTKYLMWKAHVSMGTELEGNGGVKVLLLKL